MSNLIPTQTNLPETLEDLSRFVLVGREKLVSVRAEIKAIEKVQLATEVRDQKRDEAQMLAEALLDAETRLGELMKQIPKNPGMRTDVKPNDSGVERLKKTKSEVVKDLGFSQKQAERFETLADNKDLVEQVKAEARENDDLPTRTRVLDLAQQRKKKEEQDAMDYNEYQDYCVKVGREYLTLITRVATLNPDQKFLKALIELASETTLDHTNLAISKLNTISQALKKGGVKG